MMKLVKQCVKVSCVGKSMEDIHQQVHHDKQHQNIRERQDADIRPEANNAVAPQPQASDRGRSVQYDVHNNDNDFDCRQRFRWKRDSVRPKARSDPIADDHDDSENGEVLGEKHENEFPPIGVL